MKQENYLSTVSQWMEKVMINRGNNAETVLHYCDKLQEYGEQVRDYNLLGFAQYYRGETYYLLNYAEGMFRNLVSAVDNLKKAGVHELVASAYSLLGIMSLNQGNAHFALDYYLNGLHICEKYQLIHEKRLLYYNIGSLYFKYQEYSQARKYFFKSRKLQKDSDIVFYTDASIAACYLEEGNLKKADSCIQRARKECTLPLDDLTQVYFWCFQARFCYYQQDMAGMEKYIQKIHNMINENMPILEMFENLYIYCQMLLNTEHYKELGRVLQVMDKTVEQVDMLHLQMRLLKLRIELHKKLGEQEAYMADTLSYYRLGQLAEQENRHGIISVLTSRFSLEEERKHIYQIEKENRMLQQKAEMDPLTGLFNRLRLNEYVEKAFQNAAIERHTLGIEILDIDYFKEFNDNYGHLKGDECLIKIAGLLQRLEAREEIFCARYGGDEFVIIYQKYTVEEIQKLAEQLKEKILKLKIPHKFSKAADVVTVSQGICVGIPRKGQKVWEYLYQADKMLYQVKCNSRNGVLLLEREDTGTETEKSHRIEV